MTPAHRWLPFCVFFLLSFGVAMACFVPIAFAQPAVAPPAADGVVDLTPLVDAIFAALGGVLIAVIGWIGRAVVVWFRVDTDSKYRAYVEAALQRGAEYALAKGREFVERHKTVPVKNDFLEIGLEYVVRAVPDGLKRLGLDDAAVRRAVETRLDGLGGLPKSPAA